MAANDNKARGPGAQGLFSLLNLMRLGVAAFILCYFAYLSGALEWPYLDRQAPAYTTLRFPDAPVSLAEGARVTTLYGDASELTRKPHLVAFWATWCGVCKRRLPHLAERAQEFADAGIGLAFVASDNSNLTDGASLPAWQKVPGLVSLRDDARDIFNKFGVRAVPTYALTDASGRVAAFLNINVHAEHLAQDLAGLAAPGAR